MEDTKIDPVRSNGGNRTLIGYETGPRYQSDCQTRLERGGLSLCAYLNSLFGLCEHSMSSMVLSLKWYIKLETTVFELQK